MEGGNINGLKAWTTVVCRRGTGRTFLGGRCDTPRAWMITAPIAFRGKAPTQPVTDPGLTSTPARHL